MTPNDLKKFWNTQQGIADALGCKQASVARWFAINKVPEGREYQAQLATFGSLVADKPALRTPISKDDGQRQQPRNDRSAA